MDQGLKERLIGAAVLVALGVWLIPWLLDGRQEQVELETSTSAVRLPAPDGPLPVRSQTLNLDAAKSEVLASESHPDAAEPATAPPAVDTGGAAAESAPSAPASAQESAPSPKQAAPTKPAGEHPTARVATAAPAAPKPAPKPTASAPNAQPAPARGDWAVQLGSFGAEDNAKKLAQKVNVYGYKTEVATVHAGGRAMYRVRLAGPYRSRAEADAAASAISAHGFSAQVVAAD